MTKLRQILDGVAGCDIEEERPLRIQGQFDALAQMKVEVR